MKGPKSLYGLKDFHEAYLALSVAFPRLEHCARNPASDSIEFSYLNQKRSKRKSAGHDCNRHCLCKQLKFHVLHVKPSISCDILEPCALCLPVHGCWHFRTRRPVEADRWRTSRLFVSCLQQGVRLRKESVMTSWRAVKATDMLALLGSVPAHAGDSPPSGAVSKSTLVEMAEMKASANFDGHSHPEAPMPTRRVLKVRIAFYQSLKFAQKVLTTGKKDVACDSVDLSWRCSP